MLVMADETSSLVCIDEIAPNTDQKKPQKSNINGEFFGQFDKKF